jgi:hypothetical protein
VVVNHEPNPGLICVLFSKLDDTKHDICPFEKEAANITNPEEAYGKFRKLQRKQSLQIRVPRTVYIEQSARLACQFVTENE